MIWLLDVSALVARLVQSHEPHQPVNAWWPGRALAVCPITVDASLAHVPAAPRLILVCAFTHRCFADTIAP